MIDWHTLLQSDSIIAGLFITGALAGCHSFYKFFIQRIATLNDIPARYLNGRSPRITLFGKCTSVGDGDNFRFYHTPGGKWFGWDIFREVPHSRGKLKNQTLPIRIAGVDAPECAHFGQEGQPHGKESLRWLKNYLEGEKVRIEPYRKDRYDRLVASAYVRKWPFFFKRRSVGLEMVRNGMADVFDQSCAEYGGMVQEILLRRALHRAKAEGLGMWAPLKNSSIVGVGRSLGGWRKLGKRETIETPAEYKRRNRLTKND